MIRIVADDKIPFLKGVLEPYADVKYAPGGKITREMLTGADALLTRTRTKCNPSLLDGTQVRFIATATIGFDHIDTAYCDSCGIKWTNAPGCNSSSVQQYIAAALLKIAEKSGFPLKDKTIGIIGAGNVGTKVERFARIMGMNVIICDPPRARKEGNKGFSSLSHLLASSDIVTVHVPLNLTGEDKTLHLFNDITFGLMKTGTWFFNTSRGEVAETAALKRALKQNLSGAVTDVWENEPDIDRELLDASFIATPHIAGYSTDGKANGTAMSVNELSRFYGLPLIGWYPANVPVPSGNVFQVDASGKSVEDVVRQAVFHTYDIMNDDGKLRAAPSDFEKLRGEYPLRREFPAFTVNVRNDQANASEKLRKLGFQTGNS